MNQTFDIDPAHPLAVHVHLALTADTRYEGMYISPRAMTYAGQDEYAYIESLTPAQFDDWLNGPQDKNFYHIDEWLDAYNRLITQQPGEIS